MCLDGDTMWIGRLVKQQRDPWYLIELGQYEQAVAAYTQQYLDDARPSHLRNRGLAHILMGQFEAALADFEQAVLDDPEHAGDGDYMLQGICHWYLSRPAKAVECWRASLQAPYTDWAGGVERVALLVYAGERLHDAALAKKGMGLLRGLWRKHQRRMRARAKRGHPTPHDLVRPGLSSWPGAVVPFLLGLMDVAALQREANDIDSVIVQVRQQCQADFYIAVRALIESDWATFQEAMMRCAQSSYGLLEQEYYLARWEVSRGFPEPAFPGQRVG